MTDNKAQEHAEFEYECRVELLTEGNRDPRI